MPITKEFINFDAQEFYLYKHCDDSEGALNIFKDGTLKFTQPKNFNDPFDSYAFIDPSFLIVAKDQSKFSNLQFADNLPEIAQKLLCPVENTKLLNSVRDKAFIFCLNSNPLSHLMWSHYARFHRGFMIEFKFPADVNSMQDDNFQPLEVDYIEVYPKVGGEVFDNVGDTIRTIFLQKSKEWAYEDEYRVVRYGSFPSEFQSYDRKKYLSNVIAGMNCSDEYYEKLKTAINDMNAKLGTSVQLYRAEKIPNHYAITVQNHPRLDISNS